MSAILAKNACHLVTSCCNIKRGRSHQSFLTPGKPSQHVRLDHDDVTMTPLPVPGNKYHWLLGDLVIMNCVCGKCQVWVPFMSDMVNNISWKLTNACRIIIGFPGDFARLPETLVIGSWTCSPPSLPIDKSKRKKLICWNISVSTCFCGHSTLQLRCVKELQEFLTGMGSIFMKNTTYTCKLYTATHYVVNTRASPRIV